MATIADLVRRGVLDEYELQDWEVRVPLRPLYVAPAIFEWVDSTPETYDGRLLKAKRTPLDHLEQFFADLRCSARPAVSGFRRMTPTKHGIWKCHPELLRVFGWICAPDTFVAISAVLERDVKANKALYATHMKRVRAFIIAHKLKNEVLMGDARAVFSR